MGRKSGTSGKRGRGRPRKGEQLPLIDVGPKNLKKIAPLVQEYNEAMHERVRLLKVEVEAKQKILDLVKKEQLSRMQDGSIRFECDGATVTITPRDEVIQIQEKKNKKPPASAPQADKSMAAAVAETD